MLLKLKHKDLFVCSLIWFIKLIELTRKRFGGSWLKHWASVIIIDCGNQYSLTDCRYETSGKFITRYCVVKRDPNNIEGQQQAQNLL